MKTKDLTKWKREQIDYFIKYQNSFSVGTKEYNLIQDAINSLKMVNN